MNNKEASLEECKIGWISIESDFRARINKPELLKYGEYLVIQLRNQCSGRQCIGKAPHVTFARMVNG